MAILLAVGASIGWGAADYLGGAFRQETPVLVIVAISELIGLAMLAPVLLLARIPVPDDPRLLLAGVAGVGVTLELSLIYVALSRGDAFITAPIGALGAAIAVTVGLISGDPLNLAIAAGLICALLGGGASAWTSGTRSGRQTAIRSTAICCGAAAGVAIMLSCLHVAGRVNPYWATAVEHASTALSAALIALVFAGGLRRPRLPQRAQLLGLALVGAAGVGGDVAYATAAQTGALSIVSAISSLYPLTTIALGVTIQRQRAGRIQTLGIMTALLGAAMLGTASP
jgi:drug/metabolite transporter (DMT)-like permease